MNKCNTNKYLVIANLAAFVYFFIGHFVAIPDFIEGFCIGLAITFYLIGLYANKNDITKLQQFKKRLLKPQIR